MSLKGKIEAVIYAAEEPVTLAQLAVLFGAEALAEGEPEAATPENVEAQDREIEAEAQAELIPAADASSQADGFAGESTDPQPGGPVPDELKRLARSRDRQAREQIRTLLEELMAEYDRTDRGVEIREIAGGYRVATRPEYHDSVRSFVKSLKPPMKLSLQALETLAVIAYKQPVTAPEVADIRGVDSSGVLGSLISRKLVTTAGRKAVVGRPILYKTTKEFLLRFGLKDLGELPSMEEFERMAGELVEEAEPSSQLSLATAAAIERAEDVQAAPEALSARSDEEVAAAAEATITVTDEDEPTVESDSGMVVEPEPSRASEEALKEDE